VTHDGPPEKGRFADETEEKLSEKRTALKQKYSRDFCAALAVLGD
jgi:hypothetical protein